MADQDLPSDFFVTIGGSTKDADWIKYTNKEATKSDRALHSQIVQEEKQKLISNKWEVPCPFQLSYGDVLEGVCRHCGWTVIEITAPGDVKGRFIHGES